MPLEKPKWTAVPNYPAADTACPSCAGKNPAPSTTPPVYQPPAAPKTGAPPSLAHPGTVMPKSQLAMPPTTPLISPSAEANSWYNAERGFYEPATTSGVPSPLRSGGYPNLRSLFPDAPTDLLERFFFIPGHRIHPILRCEVSVHILKETISATDAFPHSSHPVTVSFDVKVVVRPIHCLPARVIFGIGMKMPPRPEEEPPIIKPPYQEQALDAVEDAQGLRSAWFDTGELRGKGWVGSQKVPEFTYRNLEDTWARGRFGNISRMVGNLIILPELIHMNAWARASDGTEDSDWVEYQLPNPAVHRYAFHRQKAGK